MAFLFLYSLLIFPAYFLQEAYRHLNPVSVICCQENFLFKESAFILFYFLIFQLRVLSSSILISVYFGSRIGFINMNICLTIPFLSKIIFFGLTFPLWFLFLLILFSIIFEKAFLIKFINIKTISEVLQII